MRRPTGQTALRSAHKSHFAAAGATTHPERPPRCAHQVCASAEAPKYRCCGGGQNGPVRHGIPSIPAARKWVPLSRTMLTWQGTRQRHVGTRQCHVVSPFEISHAISVRDTRPYRMTGDDSYAAAPAALLPLTDAKLEPASRYAIENQGPSGIPTAWLRRGLGHRSEGRFAIDEAQDKASAFQTAARQSRLGRWHIQGHALAQIRLPGGRARDMLRGRQNADQDEGGSCIPSAPTDQAGPSRRTLQQPPMASAMMLAQTSSLPNQAAAA